MDRKRRGVKFKVCYGASPPSNIRGLRPNFVCMKKSPNLILVCEPFLLDEELRDKVTRWVEWANRADPKEYDPFASEVVL